MMLVSLINWWHTAGTHSTINHFAFHVKLKNSIICLSCKAFPWNGMIFSFTCVHIYLFQSVSKTQMKLFVSLLSMFKKQKLSKRWVCKCTCQPTLLANLSRRSITDCKTMLFEGAISLYVKLSSKKGEVINHITFIV